MKKLASILVIVLSLFQLNITAQEKFGNATLQVGDGDHIAVKTGIVTISDFRQKHIAAGGEGAPLAVYGDYFLFSQRDENRLMLNMGGIANFTYLPADLNAEQVFVTDTGPGNTLLDAFTRLHFPNLSYDKDAQIARQGSLNKALLLALRDHPFFAQKLPKTTGPELFNLAYLQTAQRVSDTTGLSVNDVMATLTEFSAQTIAETIEQSIVQSIERTTEQSISREIDNPLKINGFKIYMSGGGAHNPLLVERLEALLPCTFHTTNELGIAGDAKEAVLFALLANETIAGETVNGATLGGVPLVGMGKISFPD